MRVVEDWEKRTTRCQELASVQYEIVMMLNSNILKRISDMVNVFKRSKLGLTVETSSGHKPLHRQQYICHLVPSYLTPFPST